MELQPPGTPVRDPFFSAVRRRHPDVDIVLLPTGPDPAATEPVDDATVAQVLDRVSVAAGNLWRAAAPGFSEAPEHRIGFGAEPGTVQAASRVTTMTREGHSMMASLRSQLEDDGWRLERRSADLELALELVRGQLDDLRVRASYAEGSGAFILELSSEPLRVGRERARTLVRR